MRSRRRWPRSFWATTIAIVCGVAYACAGNEEDTLRRARLGDGCTLNSDCAAPLACTFGKCHAQCEEDRDCEGEARCVRSEDDARVCQLPEDTSCRSRADCAGEQRCGVDGECRDPCRADEDCAPGQLCAESDECASTDPDKDLLDENGNILVDPFDDTTLDGGGRHGSGGRGSGGAGGSVNSGFDASLDGSGGTLDASADRSVSPDVSSSACEPSCDATHGDVVCEDQECVVNQCDPNYDNCDDDPVTGCESRLDSDRNCGQCGRDCRAFGATCNGTRCTTVTLLDDFAPLQPDGRFPSNNWAVGNEAIYHSGRLGQGYTLRRIPLADPEAYVTVSAGTASVGRDSLVVTDTRVVWSQVDIGGAGSAVLSVQHDAQPGAMPTTEWVPSNGANLLRLHDGAYYWVSNDDASFVYWRSAAAPPNDPGTPLIDEPQGYPDESYTVALELTTDAIYWMLPPSGGSTVISDVRMLPIGSNINDTPASVTGTAVVGRDGPWVLATHGSAVYYVQELGDGVSGGIYEYHLGDASPKHVVTRQQVRDVRVDASGIYFIAGFRLYWAPFEGGPGERLYDDVAMGFIGQDATFVYVYAIEPGGKRLFKFPKLSART